ncbi:MAG: bifunctional demethylmenaquinone methyltransferase/2-methoxy-6-polyprenyl-1,4-benzoquinol methylase UbiE [Acidobacteriota bacterium]
MPDTLGPGSAGPPVSASSPPPPNPADGSGVMFDGIAASYDRVNRVLSLGLDRGWRRRTVSALELPPEAPSRVLDLATGTADLALEIGKRYPLCSVEGVDPSRQMLHLGRQKAQQRDLDSRVQLLEGDAQQLSYGEDHFDAVTIAFGIRNVPDRPAALREMARVTRPGGRIAILELAEPDGGLLAPLARFHIRTVVPLLGAWLSGDREYRYLQRSIAAFPTPSDFAQLMSQCGLEVLRVEPLTFGVCTLYVATPQQEMPS